LTAIALRTSGDRRLFFDMMITMKQLRLRNAMNVIMYTKMDRNWPMNLLKIKDALSVTLKKTPVTGRDCAKPSILTAKDVI
jgi:hypothetical protein